MFSRLCKNTIFPTSTGVNQASQQQQTDARQRSNVEGVGSSPTGVAAGTTGTSQSTNDSSTSSVGQPPPPPSSLPVSVGEGGGGGSVAVVAAAIAADRRRRRQQQQQHQQLAGRNLPSLPVAATRSRGPIRAPEPPPPYWAHYAHRPVPAVPPAPARAAGPSQVARIGGASSSSSAAGAAAAAAAAAVVSSAAAGHNSATTTDDSDTSNDRPRAHRDRSTNTSRERSRAVGTGSDGGAPGAANGGRNGDPTTRHLRYNVQQRQQRIKEHLLSQDAFCPDLVRNCKNIATDSPDRQSSASSSSSPSPAEYAEIADLGRRFATHAAINVGASTSSSSSSASARVPDPVSAASGLQPSQRTGAGAGGPEIGAAQTMGSNLSIRRPKISLTWVLREQQQQQQQQQGGRDGVSSGNGQAQHHNQQAGPAAVGAASPTAVTTVKHSQASGCTNSPAGVPPAVVSAGGASLDHVSPHTVANDQQAHGHRHTHHHHVIVRKKSRTRSKERLFSEKYVSDNNLSEYHSEKQLRGGAGNTTYANDYTAAPTAVTGGNGTTTTTTTNLYRKSNRKNSDRLKKKERLLLYANGGGAVDPVGATFHNNNNQHAINLNKDPDPGKEKMAIALKNTHSEPSLYTTVSEPSASTKHRHHRHHHHHRRRRERYRSQRFGYEISNVDEFLSKCSLSSPGNIPVVLSSAATLYQTRPGSYQIEIPLPLGMVVNAVFKNQNWLYVQTPHAEEGYVAYDTCLPLGILPSNQRSTSSSKPTPCWETNKDVFPKLCGNLTDSEKEIQQLRGGTRSEGRRTPRLKRSSANSRSAASITACNSERDLDSLYLRTVASNLPKVADGQAQYAQLKLTTKVLHSVAPTVKSEKALAIEQLEKLICSGSGDYVHLLKQQQQHLLHKQQQMLQQIAQRQQQQQQHSSNKALELSAAAIERGSVCSGNHQGTKVYGSGTNHLRIALGGVPTAPVSVTGSPVTPALAAAVATAAVRQTLLAITDNYCSEALNVHKGDVVTLLACKEYQEKGLKNYKQWFFVRTRDGHEGYIPAEAAGHGFL